MADKALIICVSVSNGSTAAVARAIASGLGAEVREPEEVDPGKLADYDLVGFGSGIYYMSEHRRLREYVEHLPEARGKRAFLFTTSGRGLAQKLPWQRSLDDVLRDKGYDVLGRFDCKGVDTYGPYGVVGGFNRGHPDVADLTHAYLFARNISRSIAGRRTRRGTRRVAAR